MSTTDPQANADVDVVALVDADITAAVEQTAARTSSPYIGSADLAVNLGALRHHIGELAEHRPDLLGDLAGHYDVPTTAFHVLNAMEVDAHDRLHHRYEAAGGYSTPSVLDVEHDGPERLAASTRTQNRPPPPGNPAPDRGMTR